MTRENNRANGEKVTLLYLQEKMKFDKINISNTVSNLQHQIPSLHQTHIHTIEPFRLRNLYFSSYITAIIKEPQEAQAPLLRPLK